MASAAGSASSSRVSIGGEDEAAVLPGLELGEPHGLGAEVETQDAVGCSHEWRASLEDLAGGLDRLVAILVERRERRLALVEDEAGDRGRFGHGGALEGLARCASTWPCCETSTQTF